LSDAANQPFFSDCGRYVMVYNGELYNFLEIKERLQKEGYQFKTKSDTEVILQSFKKDGARAFEFWNGMYAAAIWDRRERRLMLVRDRYGVKPLFYAITNRGITFGSEIKAILEDSTFERKICWKSFVEYLHYGTCLGQNSFYENVFQLLPGHFLVVENNGKITKESYFEKTYSRSNDDFATATNKILCLLESSVKSQLVSDVPVGIFLSGGIDSSAITAMASRHCSGRLSTYSAGFDFDKGVNELPKAKTVSQAFGTDHHELHIKGKDVPSIIKDLVLHHDKPFADPANIPLYLLSRELDGNPKVILQGDGGDEFFAGYPRYGRLQNLNLWRALSPVVNISSAVFPKAKILSRAKRNISALTERDESTLMAKLMSQEPVNGDPMKLISGAAVLATQSYSPFHRYKELLQSNCNERMDLVDKMMWLDTQIILPDLYFEKVDRATMARSIEVRVPMIDNELTSYVSSLPSSYKVRHGKGKYVLKKALEGLLPYDILYGPKTGFSVPFQFWLRTSLYDFAHSNILSEAFLSQGIFKKDSLTKILENHRNNTSDNAFLIYKLLNLSLWFKHFKITV
jgi:asparagine synthase (glutamine-hydrolysing)